MKSEHLSKVNILAGFTVIINGDISNIARDVAILISDSYSKYPNYLSNNYIQIRLKIIFSWHHVLFKNILSYTQGTQYALSHQNNTSTL